MTDDPITSMVPRCSDNEMNVMSQVYGQILQIRNHMQLSIARARNVHYNDMTFI